MCIVSEAEESHEVSSLIFSLKFCYFFTQKNNLGTYWNGFANAILVSTHRHCFGVKIMKITS